MLNSQAPAPAPSYDPTGQTYGFAHFDFSPFGASVPTPSWQPTQAAPIGLDPDQPSSYTETPAFRDVLDSQAPAPAPSYDPTGQTLGIGHFDTSPFGASVPTPSWQTSQAPAPAPDAATAPAPVGPETGPSPVSGSGVAPAQHAPGDDSSDPGRAGAPAPATPAAAPTPNSPLGNGGNGVDPNNPPNDIGDPNQPGGSETSTFAPIELDLSGHGIAITQLTSSNLFAVTGSDAYQHRTAWAGAGDAVLFVDPNDLGTIQNADQYIFTDWDPSATSDLQALRDVFDTNHDGKLDAGDAAFGAFRLDVTNADGTTRVETLAEAGITAIDLTADSVTQSFADGSSIDGETRFTRTDGTTGTVAAVTYASDANGYAVTTTTTVHTDGSTTIDNKALNTDGSVANETTSTTSADGLARTIRTDDAGNGVIDRSQTDVTTIDADGSRIEAVAGAEPPRLSRRCIMTRRVRPFGDRARLDPRRPHPDRSGHRQAA